MRKTIEAPLHATDRVTERLRTHAVVDLETARGAVPVVLCVDDDSEVRRLCAVTLSRAGYLCDEASDGRIALEKLRQGNYAAIVLDLSMPYLHGATVVGVLQRDEPARLRRVIVLTGAPEAAIEGLYGLVGGILRKPVDRDRLIDFVNECASAADDETAVI